MSEKYKIRNQEKLYFVTFAVVEWVDVFTKREYKEIIIDSLKYCQKHKGLEVYSWGIMSNHLHLIIGKGSDENLEDIMRDFKKFTSVSICRSILNNDSESRREWMLKIFSEAAVKSEKHSKYKFWQDRYHPIELFDNENMDQKLDYIHENPVKDGIVLKAEDYQYSSARNYAGYSDGLININYIE
jgi:REP element-mobilizing transposase RayT